MASQRRRGRTAGRARATEPWWAELPSEELMQLRLCDLKLTLEGTVVAARVDELHDEMARAGLRFKPHVWLSTDWFTPEGCSGFAMPFYLAHPRLMRLERQAMLEVEGGTTSWCRKLLRHEAGHAIDNAYRLHRRKLWRETFGKYSEPYRQIYSARPNSRDHVLHLDGWYAQSHPAEDWAETFAVWLAPKSGWQKRYDGWGALDKLDYVNDVMGEIATRPAPNRDRRRPESLPQQKQTLGAHYQAKKRNLSNPERPWVYDRYLQRVFPMDRRKTHESAHTFLRGNAAQLRRKVAQFTGHPRYVVDQALRAMTTRARETALRRTMSNRDSLTNAAILLTTLTVYYARGSRQRFHR